MSGKIQRVKSSAKVRVKIFSHVKGRVEDRRRFNNRQNLKLKMSITSITTSTHELLVVDGHHLIEKKQKTWSYANGIEKMVLVHVRTIDDKSHKVTKIRDELGFKEAIRVLSSPYLDCPFVTLHPEIQVETEMDEDEMRQFEEDWASLWNPENHQL